MIVRTQTDFATAPLLQSHLTPAHIQSVSLVVRDLDRVASFYRDCIGLDVIASSGGSAVLGKDAIALLFLTEDHAAKPQPEAMPGLFHTAFLLPTRKDLGLWLRHARATGVPLEGLSDHLVSEAAYLSDPEGNGIEIYTDRPRAEWQFDGGKPRMATLRMDVDAVLAASAGAEYSDPFSMSSGTRIGHVHLCVPDLAQAGTLLTGALGFEKMCAYPQADFYASGGYHHHIAVNTWRKGTIARRDAGYAGLSRVTLAATTAVEHRAMSERWLALGGVPIGDAFQLQSASGILFELGYA